MRKRTKYILVALLVCIVESCAIIMGISKYPGTKDMEEHVRLLEDRIQALERINDFRIVTNDKLKRK